MTTPIFAPGDTAAAFMRLPVLRWCVATVMFFSLLFGSVSRGSFATHSHDGLGEHTHSGWIERIAGGFEIQSGESIESVHCQGNVEHAGCTSEKPCLPCLAESTRSDPLSQLSRASDLGRTLDRWSQVLAGITAPPSRACSTGRDGRGSGEDRRRICRGMPITSVERLLALDGALLL